MINVIPTAIPGVVIIEPKVFGDARGYFFECFSERDFNEAMTPILGHGIKDDSIGIDWRIPTESALLSEKDTKHALFKDFDSPFSIDIDLYPEFK